MTFDSCEIFNNSNPMSRSVGCNPGYGIDVEDGYMTNQKLRLEILTFMIIEQVHLYV